MSLAVSRKVLAQVEKVGRYSLCYFGGVFRRMRNMLDNYIEVAYCIRGMILVVVKMLLLI